MSKPRTLLRRGYQTAYSLTATPFAAIQLKSCEHGMKLDDEPCGEFVVTPLKVILLTLAVLLLMVGG